MTELSRLLAASAIVDLSVDLDPRLPCSWPSHSAYRHETTNWYRTELRGNEAVWDHLGAYYTATLHLDEHTGTHIDAPSHHVPPPDSGLPHADAAGAITAEHVPIDQLIGAARTLDVTHLVDTSANGISPRVGLDILLAHEAAHGRILPGDLVLLRSGWDARLLPGAEGARYAADPLSGRAPGWPAPDEAFVEALIERGVRAIGTDAPSMGATDDGVASHRIGLGAGMVFIEAMGGLAQLPATGATVIFLGLKVVGGSGAPGRAVAFLPR